jgi:hypothetical protein
MRDYAVRQQNGQSPPSTFLSGAERDAVQTIADVAAQPVPVVTPGREELRTLLRSARANAHPDRNDGDRTAWDTVEDAANVLRLT